LRRKESSTARCPANVAFELDFIGGARPSIADPFLPAKIREGRYEDIRECIGCNVCILKAEASHHLGCTQNATAGEEYRRGWHPETVEISEHAGTGVLVVGAGPAGIECALTLARRGYLVHLADGTGNLGGHVRWMSALPGLAEWARLTEWRQIQLDKDDNVEVLVNRHLTADEIIDYGAELVVLATGSRWAKDGITAFNHTPLPGSDLPHVLTPEDIMEGAQPVGDRVVVVDAEGYVVGAGIAEHLARRGHRVEIVTPFPVIASVSEMTVEAPLVRRRLHELGVVFHTGAPVTEIRPEGVTVVNEFGESRELACQTVVLVTRRVANDDLYHELAERSGELDAGGVKGLYRVGDAVAPRLLADSIFDGQRLGREIDGPDPAVPSPYRRERVALPVRIES